MCRASIKRMSNENACPFAPAAVFVSESVGRCRSTSICANCLVCVGRCDVWIGRYDFQVPRSLRFSPHCTRSIYDGVGVSGRQLCFQRFTAVARPDAYFSIYDVVVHSFTDVIGRILPNSMKFSLLVISLLLEVIALVRARPTVDENERSAEYRTVGAISVLAKKGQK